MPSIDVPARPTGHALFACLIGGGSWQAKTIQPNNLRQQCRRLARFFRQPSPLAAAVSSPVLRLFKAVERHTTLLSSCHPDEWDATSVLTRLAWYEDHWMRAPEDWKPDLSACPADQWHSLVRHLLAAWPLPRFFESAWLTYGPLQHAERDWYCHVARGGSLRTAAGMTATLTPRALHLAMQSAPEVTIRQAIRSGQLQANGADPQLAHEVLASRMLHDFSNDAIWCPMMQKMAAARQASPGTFSLVADTLMEVIGQEGIIRAGQLIQLPLAELYRFSVHWWQGVAASLARAGWDLQAFNIHQASCRADLSGLTAATWEPLAGIDPKVIIRQADAPSLHWTFHQLTSQIHLLLEGRQLRHCVASYRKKCEAGISAIFSLRCQDTSHPGAAPLRQLTLEVECAKRRIGQVRGKWNRPPTYRELSIISQWAMAQNLKVAV